MDRIIEAIAGSGSPSNITDSAICTANNGYMYNNTCFLCTTGTRYADPVSAVCRPCNGTICTGFCTNNTATCIQNPETKQYKNMDCTDCGLSEMFGWKCQPLKPDGRVGCRFDATSGVGLLILSLVILAVILFSIAVLINVSRSTPT